MRLATNARSQLPIAGIPRADGMTAMRGSRTIIWGKYQRGGCNSEPDSRMFYKADEMSSGRSSFLSRDATELVLNSSWDA